jgi:hypothetical protein
MIVSLPPVLAGRRREARLLHLPGLGLVIAVGLAAAMMIVPRAPVSDEKMDLAEDAVAVEKTMPDVTIPERVTVDVVSVPLPELEVAKAKTTAPATQEQTADIPIVPLANNLLLEAKVVEPEPSENLPPPASKKAVEEVVQGLTGPTEAQGEKLPSLRLAGAMDSAVVSIWFKAGMVILDVNVESVGNIVAQVVGDGGPILIARPNDLAVDPRSPLGLDTSFKLDDFDGLRFALLEGGFNTTSDTVVSVKLSNTTANALYLAIKRELALLSENKTLNPVKLRALACLQIGAEPVIKQIVDDSGTMLKVETGACRS